MHGPLFFTEYCIPGFRQSDQRFADSRVTALLVVDAGSHIGGGVRDPQDCPFIRVPGGSDRDEAEGNRRSLDGCPETEPETESFRLKLRCRNLYSSMK